MRFKKTIIFSLCTILAAGTYLYVNNIERIQQWKQDYRTWRDKRIKNNIQQAVDAALNQEYPEAHKAVRYETQEVKDRAWAESVSAALQKDPNDPNLAEVSKFSGNVYDKTIKAASIDEIAEAAFPDDPNGATTLEIIAQNDDEKPETVDDQKYLLESLEKFSVKFAEAANYLAAELLTGAMTDKKAETTYDEKKKETSLAKLVQIERRNHDLPDAHHTLGKMKPSHFRDRQIIPVFNDYLNNRDYELCIRLLGAVYDKKLQRNLIQRLGDTALLKEKDGTVLVNILGQIQNDQERFDLCQGFSNNYARQKNYEASTLLAFCITDQNDVTTYDKIKLTDTLETNIEIAFSNNDLYDINDLIPYMDPSPKKENFEVRLANSFIDISEYDKGIKVASWLTHPDLQDPIFERTARKQLAENDPNGAFKTATFLPPYLSDPIITDTSVWHLLRDQPVKSMERASTLDDRWRRYEITRGAFQWYALREDFDNATNTAATIEDRATMIPLIDSIRSRWIGSFFATYGYLDQMWDTPYKGTPFNVRHDIGYNLNDGGLYSGALLLNFGQSAIGDREDFPGTNVFDGSIGLKYIRDHLTLSTECVNRLGFDGDTDRFIRFDATYSGTWFWKEKEKEEDPNAIVLDQECIEKDQFQKRFWGEYLLGVKWDNADLGGIAEKNLVTTAKLAAYYDFYRWGPTPKRKAVLQNVPKIEGITSSFLGQALVIIDNQQADYFNNLMLSTGLTAHDNGLLKLSLTFDYTIPFDNDSPYKGPSFGISFSFGGPYYKGMHYSPP
jgi:hypothetical protein